MHKFCSVYQCTIGFWHVINYRLFCCLVVSLIKKKTCKVQFKQQFKKRNKKKKGKVKAEIEVETESNLDQVHKL